MSGWWTFEHVPRLTPGTLWFSLPSYCAHTCLCACKLHFISACIHVHTKRRLALVTLAAFHCCSSAKNQTKKTKPSPHLCSSVLSLKSLLPVKTSADVNHSPLSFTFCQRRKEVAHIHTRKHATALFTLCYRGAVMRGIVKVT